MAKSKAKTSPSNDDRYRFRKNDTIGATDAEEDWNFLETCYIDTGDLAILRNCCDPRRIVLGRTGAGKTALINQLLKHERVICMRPESLSLPYISNSNILSFISALDVKLDLFFRMLWRHVFAVELLRSHFKIQNEFEKNKFMLGISSLFRSRAHQEAIKYLEQYGEKFWLETEYRIEELTSKLEESLQASVKPKLPQADFSVEAASKLTQEERKEIAQRAQSVIDKVQVKALADIMEMLDSVLTDPQKPYYIVLDRLDEDWVEERSRYQLLRALIETVRDFRRVHNVKIIVALRYDLLERIYDNTRVAGFQQEKYESLYLPLTWSRHQLVEVLDARIDHLIRETYTKRNVTHEDVLPVRTSTHPTTEYMLDRTMLRPRDFIQFFNYCIRQAIDKPQITSQMILSAEGEYSRARLDALCDEWFADYPSLREFTALLKKRRSSFTLDSISDDECLEVCYERAVCESSYDDELTRIAIRRFEGTISPSEFRQKLASVFYRTGIVGVKLSNHDAVMWSTDGRRNVSEAELQPDTRLWIHPFAHRALGILTKDASVI